MGDFVCRCLGFYVFVRDFLLRDCDTTYFGPAILQYVNGGIGNDGKTREEPNNLATKRSRVNKYIYIYIHIVDKFF